MTMSEREWLAERFEEHRRHLRAVAYRMLGSLNEADDAVQEVWIRLNRSDAAAIENLGGWLTTVVGRVCLNILKARGSRREEPTGVHVPDPVVSPESGVDPEQEALLADSVGLALVVVLETLTPAERRGAARGWPRPGGRRPGRRRRAAGRSARGSVDQRGLHGLRRRRRLRRLDLTILDL